MEELYIYIFYFIIGGMIVSMIYHFGKGNNTLISAILPSIPIMFLTGFFILLYYKGNIKKYVKNSICTFMVLVLSLFVLYFLLSFYNEYLCSILFVFFFLMYYVIHIKI